VVRDEPADATVPSIPAVTSDELSADELAAFASGSRRRLLLAGVVLATVAALAVFVLLR
jgi:hypothetical protein